MSGEDYCKRCIHKNVCHTVAECLNSWQDDFSCNEFEKVRPRGHWQVIGYHADKYFYCKCSNCQKKTKVFYDKTNPGEFGSLADIKRNVNFCMFCGADMREDEE